MKSIQKILILLFFIGGLMSSSLINKPIVVKDDCKINKTLTYDNKQNNMQRAYIQYEIVVIAKKITKNVTHVNKITDPVQVDDVSSNLQDVEQLTSPIPSLTVTSLDVSNIYIPV